MSPPATGVARRPLAAAPAPARRPAAPPRRAPRKPKLEVVRPDSLQRLRPRKVGTIAGLLLFVALFGLVAFQTVLIGAQGEVDELRQRVETQETINRDLSIEAADLRSPERVAVAAKERLGMIEPGSVTFLRSSNEGLRSSTDEDAAAAP